MPLSSRSRFGWAAVIVMALAAPGDLYAPLSMLPALTEHFRIHMVVGAALLAVGLLLLRRRPAALALLAIGAVNLWVVLATVGASLPAVAAPPPALKLLSLNLNVGNRNLDALRALVAAEQPDVMFLQEPAERTLQALMPLFQHHHLSGVDWGPAILSRLPLRPQPTRWRWHVAIAEVDWAGAPLRLVNAHLPRPFPGREGGARASRLEAIAEQGAPRLIVAGDFNSAPWATPMRRLRGSLGVELATGARSSWPSAIWPFGIPIDHVMLRGLAATEVRIGPDVGSDHRPVIATLASR